MSCTGKEYINTAALEARIGHRFSRRELLVRALTHSSYSNESGERNHHLLCNERLEFLGDSVLSVVVSEYLFGKYPDRTEGELTKIRSEVVCTKALATYARELELGKYLLLGIGEARNGGSDNENILEDAFEALLAALYLDCGDNGKNTVSALVIPFVERYIAAMEERGGDGDYKTPLQQLVQQSGSDILEYVLVGESGPDHMKTFEVEARLNSNVLGRGTGRSKRKAEQAAAKAALELFGVK
ncbi:MAG: ribonuclease III [Clostridia bacterium]|nr:ribonuclease III [Clostridia bacterium]